MAQKIIFSCHRTLDFKSLLSRALGNSPEAFSIPQQYQHPKLGAESGSSDTAMTFLDAIKHVVMRYTGFIWAILKPMGSWGVFVLAGLDSAFFGLPLDPVVASYVYQNRTNLLLYVFMASAGSAVGSIVLYGIGYKGGQVLLEKRISKSKFDKIRHSFDRHEFWALMFPAMVPPPFPFKLFALAAAAFEMNFWHFLLAIFAGRFVRFFLLGILVLRFGPGIVAVAADLAHKHLLALTLAIGLLAVAFWFFSRFGKSQSRKR